MKTQVSYLGGQGFLSKFQKLWMSNCSVVCLAHRHLFTYFFFILNVFKWHIFTLQFATYLSHTLNFMAPRGMWVHHPRLFSHSRLTRDTQFPRSFLEFTIPEIHCQLQYVMYDLPLMAIKNQNIHRFLSLLTFGFQYSVFLMSLTMSSILKQCLPTQ